MADNQKYKKEINRRLLGVERKKTRVEIAGGFFTSITIFSILFLLAVAVESVYRPGIPERTVIAVFMFISCAALLINYILIPLVKMPGLFIKPDYNKTAMEVGRFYPEIKDELSNALQLLDDTNGGSPALVDAAFKKVYEKSKGLDFKLVVRYYPALVQSRWALGSLTALLAIFFVVPGFRSSVHRIKHFRTEFTSPPAYTFRVEPGNARLIRGDEFNARVTATGEQPPYLYLNTKSDEQTEFESKKLLPDSTGIFTYKNISVTRSFDYYVSYDKTSSETFNVTVVNPPVVKQFSLQVTPPAYSGLPRTESENNGNVTGLPGTGVEIKLNSSKLLSRAVIGFEKDTVNMEVNGSSAEARFYLVKNDSYRFYITDTSGNGNENPIEYEIKTLTDEYPAIEIIRPEGDTRLSQDDRVRLFLTVADDYGFSKLVLNYRISQSEFNETSDEFSTLELPVSKNSVEDEIDYAWDLTELYLGAEDVVTYYLEIYDNDTVNGPKSTKSKMLTVRVPSLDEIFADADNTQEESAQELEETLKEAEKLREEMENLGNEMKRDDREITFEEKERMEDALKKFEELSKKAEDVSKKINEMRQELQENNMLSEETMKKYMELQEVMEEFSDENMKEALKRMQDMMKQMNRDQAQNSLENMKEQEEMFRKSLERTINLLKRLQIEQKMDEMVKRAESMKENMEELSQESKENSGKNDSSKKEELAKRQEKATQDLEKMREEMEDLKEKMSEFDDMPKEEMEKLAEEFDKQKNNELSEQAKENLEQNKMEQAAQNQQQMQKNMEQMQSSMQQMQQQMQMQNQMQVFNKMMKATDDLLTLSREQEDLKKKSESRSGMEPMDKETAREQAQLEKGLDKILNNLSELSQKTFAVNPEMGKAMGQAKMEMNRSMDAMQSNNSPLAARHQGNSMKNLNEAAAMMKNAMQSMMQSGGQGGGMMSLMQQMQQMSQQQMGLNKMTQMLKQQQGRMSQEQMAQLQRLAGQQQALQKSLEQLNRESKLSGESKKIAADLERIAAEMREVVTGMKTEKLDDELLLKQERILSKMLDAQRSINERDFEKRRESKGGEVFARKSPAELLKTEEGRKELRDELIKAAREGYSKDYEELIRKYFRALEEEAETGNSPD